MLATVLLSAALFAPGSGWHVGADSAHACPGVGPQNCEQVGSWAATVPWRDCGECLPHRTLAKLPADGIVIHLLLAREEHPPKWVRPLHWPPRLAPVVSPFEGLPSRIGVFQTLGSLHGLQPYLFVFFGRPHPTHTQVARARAELASAEFPGVRLDLLRRPYVARACRGTTSPACKRIGVAVWLRHAATAVIARIGTERVKLKAGGLGGRAPTYWQGFVRTHPPQLFTLHLIIWHGTRAVAGHVTVPLREGWG